MNILYLAHRIPFPPDKGDKLRAFRQIEHLSKRHPVWCACFVDAPDDQQHVESLRRYCRGVTAVPLNRRKAAVRGLWGLMRGGTVTEAFYRSDAMSQALRDLCDSTRFDVAVAFSSSMAPYVLSLPAKRRVLDMCDCDSRKWLDYAETSAGPSRWLYGVEGSRLSRRERSWTEAFDATILITEAEATSLRAATATTQLHIVGNGVVLPELRAQRPAPLTVGFVGVMDYRPNVDAVCWFASECWKEIRAAFPDAIFRIVGRSPLRRVCKLQRAPGVEVVGGVNDVLAELERFDVSVAPMRIARGLQNKVLEAMAAAKPVVLTRKAAEGIDAEDGRDYLIADHADRTIRNVRRLMGNAAERERIGQAARRFVTFHHRWDDVLAKFELIVTGIVERSADVEPPHTAIVRSTHPASLAVSQAIH